MRLDAIRAIKEAVGSSIPACAPVDISDKVPGEFRLTARDPLKRRIMRLVAAPALAVLRHRYQRLLACPLSFAVDALCHEERFGDDASATALFKTLAGNRPDRVLIPGCYLGGEDVQFWLRRGVKRLDGVDLNRLAKRWNRIVPALRMGYGAEIHFKQAPLERLPFPDACFDLIATSAVLEHVQNLDAMSAETARVLKARGIAWHSFGPLYFSFGADHCIAAYGDECGYDHLLLSEDEYQSRIGDQSFYDRHCDPNLPFWARHNQFSFASAREYLNSFGKYFRVRHVVAKISEPGLQFRRRFPDKWHCLRTAGVAEEDLLIKGISVVLQKGRTD